SNPADAEVIVVLTQDPAGRPPIEWRLAGPPRAWHHVETFGGDPTPRQFLGQGARHGDDRVEAAERAALQPLVTPVLPVPSREAVHRRYDRDSEPPGHDRIEHVGSVAVRVDDVRPQVRAQLSKRRALP